MASDWIKMRVLLGSDPKVISMSEHLAVNRFFMDWISESAQKTCDETAHELVSTSVTRSVTVAGLLVVWGIASERGKRDGQRDMRVTHATIFTLDEISGVPGFGAAMESVGWVVEDGKDIIFPGFCEENSIFEDRKKNGAAERQRKKRERDKLRDARVTGERDSHAKSNAREEKRIEEKNREEINQDPPNPPPGGTEFQAAVAEWLAYKAEKGQRYKPRGLKAVYAQLAAMGEARAIAAIRASMAANYAGIFEPNTTGPPRPHVPRKPFVFVPREKT